MWICILCKYFERKNANMFGIKVCEYVESNANMWMCILCKYVEWNENMFGMKTCEYV